MERGSKENRAMEYLLGVDIGGTKSQALLANASGQALGFGESGAGNWEDVGYEGLAKTLNAITDQALAHAGVSKAQVTAAGFGIAGYDWLSQREPHLAAIRTLELDKARVELVNDTIIGLIAGSPAGWGLGIVAGTRANCWGRDRQQHIGRMTGYGSRMAEGAGGLEIVAKAVQAVALEWTRRGPPTRLTHQFMERTGARDFENLVEGLSLERIQLDASAAPLVFKAAEEGDVVAIEIVLWAGHELGSLAVGVIRQLNFEALVFDAVLIGSLFRTSPLLRQAMRQTVHAAAPGARFVTLDLPAAVGGVLLGMEQVGVNLQAVRETLLQSTKELISARRATGQ
jgi:N-acetylglucosamine kinase-like BadF-type ATPase